MDRTPARKDHDADWHAWNQLSQASPSLDLTFNAPLSDRCAETVLGRLGLDRVHTILDLGCGWGELLLHALERAPAAKAVGVDLHPIALERAGRAAAARGLAGRVRFVEGDLETMVKARNADLVLAVGIGSPTRPTRHVLTLARENLRPGGAALLGDGYWRRRLDAAERRALGTDVRELGSLLDLERDAVAAGFDVSFVVAADDDAMHDYAERTSDGLRELARAGHADLDPAVVEASCSAFAGSTRFEWTQFPGRGPAVEILGEMTGRRVLEIGVNAALVADRGAIVHGVDLSSVAIETARSRVPDAVELTFHHAAAETFLRGTDQVFDVVYSVFGAIGFVDPFVIVPLIARRQRAGGWSSRCGTSTAWRGPGRSRRRSLFTCPRVRWCGGSTGRSRRGWISWPTIVTGSNRRTP